MRILRFFIIYRIKKKRDYEEAVTSYYKGLSKIHISHEIHEMSLLPNLFGIRLACRGKVRRGEGRGTCGLEDLKM